MNRDPHFYSSEQVTKTEQIVRRYGLRLYKGSRSIHENPGTRTNVILKPEDLFQCQRDESDRVYH